MTRSDAVEYERRNSDSVFFGVIKFGSYYLPCSPAENIPTRCPTRAGTTVALIGLERYFLLPGTSLGDLRYSDLVMEVLGPQWR